MTVDDTRFGSTPLFKVKLRPGKHKVLLVNEGAGIRVSRSITIESGKTTKLDEDLSP